MNRFSAGLKSSSPLLKQGAPTKLGVDDIGRLILRFSQLSPVGACNAERSTGVEFQSSLLGPSAEFSPQTPKPLLTYAFYGTT